MTTATSADTDEPRLQIVRDPAVPIRVLFVTSSLRPGAAGRHAAMTLPALDPERFEVRVICTRLAGPFASTLVDHGIPVKCLNAPDGAVGTIRAVRELAAQMSRWRPDVVMSNGFHADVLARLAARHVGVPAVIAWRHGCGHRRHNGARDRVTERLTGRLVSRYFAVAENQLPYLTEELGLPADKIRVIHNSVPLPTSRRTARDHAVAAATRPPTVAAISRLHEEKDHAVLLRAMRIVVDELPDAQLVIIGDGPMRHELEALTRGLRLADNVSFFGNRYDVATLLPGFDVLAISSYTIECLPYTVLEAMSAAVPVVATRVGGLSELIEDGKTGYLVEPKDNEALAARLIEILRDPRLGRALGVAGQLRLADEFSFEEVIRQLEAEITQVATMSLIPYPR